MGIMFDKIRSSIITRFQIARDENLIVKQQISKGYSGAEVYLVELGGDSLYKGRYYLKIDKERSESANVANGYRFSNVARIVKSDEIESCFVMLIQVAGGSQIEYKAFYETEPLSVRVKATQKIVSGILREAVDGDYMKNEENPSVVFHSQLSYKLDEGGELFKYVGKLTGDGKQGFVKSFYFGSYVLPNAFAFAIHDDFWGSERLRDTRCAVHGDLHGNNVFYSEKSGEYALIDMSLYREDGYLFYDTAYFELSFILEDMVYMDLDSWVKQVWFMSEEKWPEVEAKNRDCLKEIRESENRWIESQNNSTLAYHDFLKEAALTARVMAGLNYSGKMAVNDETRRKSFLYACIYMKRLLDMKGIVDWKMCSIPWKECEEKNVETDGNEEETRRLAEELDNFAETRRYILMLGDEADYQEGIYENLSRIRWDGIVTFSNEKTIEDVLGKYRTVNAIISQEDFQLITSDSLWCFYVDGVDYRPETLTANYGEWVSKSFQTLFYWKETLESVYAPDDLQFILDWSSFSVDAKEKLMRFCDVLNTVGKSCVSLSVLSDIEDARNSFAFAESVRLERYAMRISDLSEYCMRYLAVVCEEEVQIPAVSRSMKTIPADEYKYISSHVTVVNSHLTTGRQLSREEVYGFYAGKPIAWQAVEEHLYIDLPEYDKYMQKIQEKIDKTDQFLLRIDHKPGAGASVMVRALAWRLREKYPVLLAEKMDRQIVDCSWRVYSKSGKHILLFLDGDFSENDVSAIRQQARNVSGLKIGILYTCRKYDNVSGIMSILETGTALDFCKEYSRRITEVGKYTAQICELREKNMHALATHSSLCNYRLPFFFGINAFEEDYESINDYINEILGHLDSNEVLKKTIAYIALITYYTENDGLNINYARKLMGLDSRTSTSDLLKQINGKIQNFAYYTQGKIRICHPVVAHEILTSMFQENASGFEPFLEEFVTSLSRCEGGKMSERLKKLFTELFIKRNMETDSSGEDEENRKQKRESFSPIVLSIGNALLQEKFFAFLVKKMPENVHIHQHFGRLIITNDPSRLMDAKEQFDYAVKHDSDNPIHYHARGDMYAKYIINHYIAMHKNVSVSEAYDEIAPLADCAIADFKECIRLIGGGMYTSDVHMDSVDPVYPYSSTVRTVTYVVNYLFELDNSGTDRKEFLERGNIVSDWCRDLIETAKRCDMETEERYERMREDNYYKNAQRYLVPFCHSESEMEAKLDSGRGTDNIKDKREYLYSLDTSKKQWKTRDKKNLMRIKNCSEQVINEGDTNDGILWRWFYANAYLGRESLLDIRIYLQSLDPNEKNLSLQFMQYVAITGQYLRNANESDASEITRHIQQCKKLNQNSNKTRTRLFYVGGEGIAFRIDRNEKVRVEGTVSRWLSPQNGQIQFGPQSKLSAFFVPSVISMPQEGAVGRRVTFILGASYDGFRAWDVEMKN